MQTKILVAYTSNAGSTGEVAQAIGQELSQERAQVDVRRIGEIGDVSAAQAGDRRNWDAIRGWAAGLRAQFVKSSLPQIQ